MATEQGWTAMICNEVQRRFLDRDWDQAALDEAAAILDHVSRCPACRHAVREYDQLRSLLRVPNQSPNAPIAAPEVPWNAATGQQPGLRRFAGRWAWATALAASLLLAVTGWAMYLRRADAPGEVAARTPPAGRMAAARPAVQWTGDDVEREVSVFNNVSATFDGRTSWVATGDGAAELGLMPAPSQPRKVLLLRLMVSEGENLRSRTDLVIVPGQDASLDVPFQHGLVLHYYIATVADRDCRLSVWAEVRRPNGDGATLAALATQLKPVPGQLLSAGRLVTASGGYNLEIAFQEQGLPGR
jgi:hypothetical protein